MLSVTLLAAALVSLSSGAESPAPCSTDEVVWKGGCASRYRWEPDDPTCPGGVIVVPEGKDAPACIPCAAYRDGMQQAMNYCTGLLAEQADARMQVTLEQVIKNLPAPASELREQQATWLRKRDAACRRKGQQYEGGSLQPQVESQCRLDKTRKRDAELARLAPAPPPTPVSAGSDAGCGGDLSERTPIDRRARVVAERSPFFAQARHCPATGDCPWRRRGYLVRGDEVVETAVNRDFACVRYKKTAGWLPLHDLCEADASCDGK